MAISGNLPKHLEVAARTGVLTSPIRDDFQYRQVAAEIDLSTQRTDLVDLGGMPVPTENPKDVDTLIEKAMIVNPKDWYLTLSISQNAIDDDQTGSLLTKFQNLNPAFQRQLDTKTFELLNAGDGATLGVGYDGQHFFSDAHVDKGASYKTAQDNENALALDATNFNAVMASARQFRDDQSNFTNYAYNLLIGNTVLEPEIFQISSNAQLAGTAERDINPWAGLVRGFTRPELDTTAWMLIASSEVAKPIIVGIRKRPTLSNMWFDSQAGDGGIHYFQYHARYVHVFGDWRLAAQGNT